MNLFYTVLFTALIITTHYSAVLEYWNFNDEKDCTNGFQVLESNDGWICPAEEDSVVDLPFTEKTL